jgi:hypothetical protein
MGSHFHVQHTFDTREVAKLLESTYAEYYHQYQSFIHKFEWDEDLDIRVTTHKILAESILQFQIQAIFLREDLSKSEWWKEHFQIDESEQSTIIDNQITHFNQEIVEGILQVLFIRLESFLKSIYAFFKKEQYISESIDFRELGCYVISKTYLSEDYVSLIQILNNIRHVVNNDGFFKLEDSDVIYRGKEFLFTKDSILPVEYVTWNYIEFYLLQASCFISDVIESEIISKAKQITNPALHVNYVSDTEVYKVNEDNVNQALLKLQGLDLKTVTNRDVIINEISKIGYIPYLITTLFSGMSIYRARPNDGKNFGLVKDLSYVPPENNTRYKRASTPENTMFYGAVTSDSGGDLKNVNEEVVLLCEASKLYRQRDRIDEDTEILTLGKWVVTKDIPLISIVQYEGYKDESKWVRDNRNDYKRFIRQFPTIRNQIIKATNFFAEEFAKEVKENENHDYMISALFTERILNNIKRIEKPIGGILYPSKQAEGSGLCVAILPEWVDECMKLVEVVEVKVYKKGRRIATNNLRECHVEPNSTSFILNEITDSRYRSPEEVIKKILDGEIIINEDSNNNEI